MSVTAQKPHNVLEDAATAAAGANTDGRGRNIVFKHKQLTRLFGEYLQSCLMYAADDGTQTV